MNIFIRPPLSQNPGSAPALPSPIGALLRDVVNLLASGKVPVSVSKFLAGGSLTALDRNKPNCLPAIHPIAVGEALCCLVGKSLCAVTKEKASEYFAPLQMGVVCPSGAEKMIHGLRHCVEDHWMDEDFAIMKIDMRNAFNLVSRQALLDECSAHFPELLPGPHGVSVSTLLCGIPWVSSV